MRDVRVYLEGGGTGKEQKAELRRGFDDLFGREKSHASEKRRGLAFICCGGRQEAYEAFRNAIDVHPERINALLIDSEAPIAPVPADRSKDARLRRDHLLRAEAGGGRRQGDGWQLTRVAPDCIHLMVQCMEAWIVADPEALEEFYKQGFRKARLPQRNNLEEEPKADIFEKLDSASEGSKKGKYAKINHASKLLAMIDPEKVVRRCPRFSIFRDWLTQQIEGTAA